MPNSRFSKTDSPLQRQVDPAALATHRSKRGLGRASMLGAVLTAIAASSCCILPAIFALLGVSGVGLAASIQPYRPLLLGLTALMLAVGFVVVYRRPRRISNTETDNDTKTDDRDACGCDAKSGRKAGKRALWIVTAFVVLFAAYPYIAAATADTQQVGSATETADSRTLTMHVDGMTCESCASTLADTIAAVPGVVRADVSFDNETATVVYDPSATRPAALTAAVGTVDNYKATVVQ